MYGTESNGERTTTDILCDDLTKIITYQVGKKGCAFFSEFSRKLVRCKEVPIFRIYKGFMSVLIITTKLGVKKLVSIRSFQCFYLVSLLLRRRVMEVGRKIWSMIGIDVLSLFAAPYWFNTFHKDLIKHLHKNSVAKGAFIYFHNIVKNSHTDSMWLFEFYGSHWAGAVTTGSTRV